jgi:hypothetical protein
VNEGSLRKHIQNAHANVTNSVTSNASSSVTVDSQITQQVELVTHGNNGETIRTGSVAALGLLACSVCRQMFTSKNGTILMKVFEFTFC